ncbi:MAG TPA: immunoglobulin domain-containing protein [Verrucomicrobiae bacterium]
MKRKLICSTAFLALAAVTPLQAQFNPIQLTPGSYLQDVIVEREALRPFVAATTASMDGGTNNSGWTYYEIGYNIDAPETGIPAAGSTFTSQDLPDHTFQMAASYKVPNALMIDQVSSNGTFIVTTPAAYSGVSLLIAAANGSVGLNYTLQFSDGTSEMGTVTAPDWFGASPTAVTAGGRAAAQAGTYANVGSADPRIYSADIVVTNASKLIRAIEFSFGTGGENGRAAIFALSGSTGAEFTPVAISGFTQDIIIEFDAAHAGPVLSTDATLDGGVNNAGATFYEIGFNPYSPTTGVTRAGTTLTNAAGDHVYRMATSFAAPNAVVIDSLTPTATLTLATPAAHSALSVLGSSGGGAVTLTIDITHEDSSVQTGTIVIPDWFNVVPYVLATRGRVNIENGVFESVNTENPRLYGVDIAVQNTTSPIASITLTHASGGGHATIFALSGTAGAVKPIFEVQPANVSVFENTPAQIAATVSGTAPITFQWQREVNGSYVNVAGGTGSTLDLSSASVTNTGSYILVASNVGGSSTSLVARLTVFSTAADITSPTDVVTIIGGNSPENEPVANAIDNTTSKYLNFGADGDQANPFVGPAGFEVTPAVGSTVVTGLRVYTANDADGRDPADYKLEGSTDGQNYTVISSGSLALPGARNAAGLELDPLTQGVQEVLFSNTAGYTSYRVTFTNLKNSAGVNSMQIGEVELLGVTGTGTPQGPRLQITRSSGGVNIAWDGGGTLQATTDLANPNWTTVPGSSPVTVPTTGSYQFFRVVR